MSVEHLYKFYPYKSKMLFDYRGKLHQYFYSVGLFTTVSVGSNVDTSVASVDSVKELF